jgi:hypothetical protein
MHGHAIEVKLGNGNAAEQASQFAMCTLQQSRLTGIALSNSSIAKHSYVPCRASQRRSLNADGTFLGYSNPLPNSRSWLKAGLPTSGIEFRSAPQLPNAFAASVRRH